MSDAKNEALKLLPFLSLAPEDTLPKGATLQQLDDFEARTSLRLPHQIKDCLLLCNGPCVAEGGVYGIRADRPFLDIETYLNDCPEWLKNKWLPVAGDSCGNTYVAVLNSGNLDSCPVFFIDHETDGNTLSHQIAPDFWTFLVWLFRRDLNQKQHRVLDVARKSTKEQRHEHHH